MILATAIRVRGFTNLIRFKEQHLRHTFVGVDLGGQWRGVGELQRHMPFPLRLERRHVHDDAAAHVGRLAETHGQDAARDAEVLDGARERERIRRDDAHVRVDVDEILGIERLRVDDGRIDVGEYFGFVCLYYC